MSAYYGYHYYPSYHGGPSNTAARSSMPMRGGTQGAVQGRGMAANAPVPGQGSLFWMRAGQYAQGAQGQMMPQRPSNAVQGRGSVAANYAANSSYHQYHQSYHRGSAPVGGR